jgi:hypothetical protein
MTTEKRITKKTAIIMFLMCVPMMAGSLLGCYGLYVYFSESRAMQSWIETPATILESGLNTSESTSRSGGRRVRSTAYSVSAEYSYVFDGIEYEASRVSIIELADNFSPSYHRRQSQMLREHRDSGIPFPCFVNPERPEMSILFRDPPLYQIGVISSFVLVFFTLGFGGTFASLKYPIGRFTGDVKQILKTYDFLLGVTMTIGLLMIVIPITYFTYIELAGGAALRNGAWFILPILVIVSTIYGLGLKPESGEAAESIEP